MGYEEEIANAIGVLLAIGLIMAFIVTVLYYLSETFNEYNQTKAEELRRVQEAENKDRELITQAKKHSLQYSEEFVRDIQDKNKNDLEYEIDFNINLAGSTVKTEVVYAE